MKMQEFYLLFAKFLDADKAVILSYDVSENKTRVTYKERTTEFRAKNDTEYADKYLDALRHLGALPVAFPQSFASAQRCIDGCVEDIARRSHLDKQAAMKLLLEHQVALSDLSLSPTRLSAQVRQRLMPETITVRDQITLAGFCIIPQHAKNAGIRISERGAVVHIHPTKPIAFTKEPFFIDGDCSRPRFRLCEILYADGSKDRCYLQDCTGKESSYDRIYTSKEFQKILSRIQSKELVKR